VDAGIVYKTDAQISKKVKIAYEVPAKDAPPISYPMAVVKEARNPDKAADFLRYLESEDSTKVFERYGFIVVNPSAR
jgi:molybdate transport system substrate-binding protein